MALYWQPGDPLSATATCSREQAETLIRYDHHRATIGDRWALLISLHWLPLEEAPAPLELFALFHPPAYHNRAFLSVTVAQVRAVVQNHPPVPSAIQLIVDGLSFLPHRDPPAPPPGS